MKCKILMIEDEKELSDAVCVYLKHYGYDVRAAYDGRSARLLYETFEPNIILLDVMLPDEYGMDLCEHFRSGAQTGIIFMTALSSKENVMAGFRSGADDYVTKPFDLDILKLRIEALEKRLSIDVEEENLDYEIMFDSYNNKVIARSKVVNLTPTEFKIFYYLHRSVGFVTATELTQSLYGLSTKGIPTRTISVHVAKIRKKLQEEQINWIQLESKYKEGYRLLLG